MRFQLALVSFFLSSSVWANHQCDTASIPITATNWNQTVNLVRFDPQLGTLNGFTITVTSTMTGSCSIENLQSFPMQTNLIPTAAVTVHRPDNTALVTVSPMLTFTDNLTAYDGTLDFGGTSGASHSGINFTMFNSAMGTAPDLALFTGAPGNPGTIALSVSGMNVSIATAPGNPVTQFLINAGAIVDLCYDYTPMPYSFCPGDGSGTACPCGNSSAVGAAQGCVNSLGTGAHLGGSGMASVSNDTFVLTCNGLPTSAAALFFQGNIAVNGGAGAVFGDGLRCVFGSVVRLHVKFASGGVATYPQAGDTPISIVGGTPPNLTRLYQVWYRNSAAFCTVDTYNMSQGLGVAWQP